MRPPLRTAIRLTTIALVITTVWLVAGVFLGWQHHTAILSRGASDDLSYRLIGMAASMFVWAMFTPLVVYVSDLLPLRKPFRVSHAILIALFAIVIATLRALVDGWWPAIIEELPMASVDYQASVLALFHNHLLLCGVVIGVANFMRLEREDSARVRAEARLQAELAEARLRQLRADLHPHFLFNTLNAVAALVHSDGTQAEVMLARLRELLRASIASDDVREVRLSEELEFIRGYFDIQKMRFGDKLTTAIHVEAPHLQNAAVPPLLLQPLVENSIVHGITARRDGGSVIVIVDTVENGAGGWLRLQVRDNGPGCRPEDIFGRGSIGVPNAIARLESIYGARQSLRYVRSGAAFIAEIRIPLRIVA
jgi:two-component system LytT family sensor kinase